MKKSDKIKYQKMTLIQLNQELSQARTSLVELRLKHATEPVGDTSLFVKLKTKISYLNYLISLTNENSNQK